MLLDAEREAAKVAVQLEREETEAQMAGGFAHEMLRALAGPNMMLMGTLGKNVKTWRVRVHPRGYAKR